MSAPTTAELQEELQYSYVFFVNLLLEASATHNGVHLHTVPGLTIPVMFRTAASVQIYVPAIYGPEDAATVIAMLLRGPGAIEAIGDTGGTDIASARLHREAADLFKQQPQLSIVPSGTDCEADVAGSGSQG